jgi:high-affinity Fe2+/Pb2+ permease
MDKQMVYLTVAMMALPSGLVIYIWGSNSNSSRNMIIGGLIVALSVIMWFVSVRTALKEQKDDADKQDKIIELLKDISKKVG